MNNIIFDIPELIKNKTIDNEKLLVKEFEDSISNQFNNNISTLLENNPLIFLWTNLDIIKHDTFNLLLFDEFNLNLLNLNDCVITGSYVRSILQKQNNIKYEITLNYIKNIDINCINYIDYKDNGLFYTKILNINNKIISVNINKKIFISPTHVLLSNSDYLKRIGYYNGNIYFSSMFIIEYLDNINIINSTMKDPVFNTSLDIFDICDKQIKIKHNTVFDLINRKDYNLLLNINFDHTKLKDNLTCIEYAIKLYISEDCLEIKKHIKQTIIYLSTKKYDRPPIFYAKLTNLLNNDKELYNIIEKSIDEDDFKYDNLINSKISNIDDINNIILIYLITQDDFLTFFKYIKTNKVYINKLLIQNLINYKPLNILTYGIDNNLFKDYIIYDIILRSEQLDYFEKSNFNFNLDNAINFLDVIIKNNLVRSFYYLYKLDNTIINSVFNINGIIDGVRDKSNILFLLTQTGDYILMLELLLKLNINLLNFSNENGDTPILYHTKQNNILLVKKMLEYNNQELKLELNKDNDGNTLLHIMCYHNVYDYIKYIVNKYSELLNLQNNNLETPIIIATKKSHDNIFYILQGLKADLTKTDIYGNTPYHYICKNEICIGIAIMNTKNKFGYTPKDYCKIAHSYYYFL